MTKDTNSQKYLDLKTELRSLLISSQQGCNEQQLIRDYAAYNTPKEIPYRDMGYRNLIELLTSMPDVATIDQTRVPIIIRGVADPSTVHIQKLVMAQKRKKRTGNGRGGTNRNNSFNRTNGSSVYSRNRQAAYYPVSLIPFQPYSQIISTNRNQWDTYSIPNTSTPPQYHTTSYQSPSVINNSVENYVHQTPNGTIKSSATKTVASFPPKKTQTPPLDDNSSFIDDDLNDSDDDELTGFDLQRASEHGDKIILLRKRIRHLLFKLSNGLWLSSVHRLYQKTFGEELKLEEFKLKNLMALFDCVSDFVNSERDRLPDSTDRILLLKPNFTEATRKEQQTLNQIESTTSISILKDNQNTMNTDQNSHRLLTNVIDRPIVDLSSFVSLDFHFNRTECKPNEPFDGFLGDVEDPWNIHIGNVQFISKRECMMTQLQEHYTQSSNQSIYVIPFEQLQINLSCVYYHTDNNYYRSFIVQIDHISNPDILILKIYLVDYGVTISDINYHINSTNLKFLHKNFSSLSTQVYDCRLANINYPVTSIQWPDDTRQFIIDLCQDKKFSVEIVGIMDSVYCINLWIIDQNHQQSINQLLIKRGFAIQCDDTQYSEFQSISPKLQSTYLDEKLFAREGQNHVEYNLEENQFKRFIISIEHAYYFVKHPYTKRPCLPCFEIARLLGMDEANIPQLNLVRETEVRLSESNRKLFNDLCQLPESIKCPHINRNDNQATIKLYDLSSIRDHLLKIKFKEGDVVDAFQQEYEDYERPGYWNEKKNSYICEDNLQSHQDGLSQRRGILNFRRDQLASVSKTHQNISSRNEMQDIEQELKTINQELHSMETILPPIKFQSANTKMRETLFRIARPFDQQFSLTICFNHQCIDRDIINNENNDIEERFRDLHRITKNVIQFFSLESEIADEEKRQLLNEVQQILPDLIENISLNKRIEIYNYCLQVIEYFQPTIQNYVQRTDLIDTIY